MLGHVQEINPGPLDDGAVRRLFERIIDEARRLERIAEGESPGDPDESGVDGAQWQRRSAMGADRNAMKQSRILWLWS